MSIAGEKGSTGNSQDGQESGTSQKPPGSTMEYSAYHETIAWELSNAVKRYFRDWQLVLTSGNALTEDLWTPRIEQSRISLVLLSGVLNEAVINFVLSTQMSTQPFKAIERQSLAKKWSLRLKEVIHGYEITPELRDDIDAFVNRRNAMVHPQPMISLDGDSRHEGNLPKIKCDEHALMRNWVTLTRRLLYNLEGYNSKTHHLTYSLAMSSSKPVRTWNQCQAKLDEALKESNLECKASHGNHPQKGEASSALVIPEQ